MKAMAVRWELVKGGACMYLPNEQLVCTVFKMSLGWAANDRHGCVVSPARTRKQAMSLAEAYYGVREVPDAIQWIPVSQPPPLVEEHPELWSSNNVLVTDGAGVFTAYLQQDKLHPDWPPMWVLTRYWTDMQDITHWAPLPTLPEGETG